MNLDTALMEMGLGCQKRNFLKFIVRLCKQAHFRRKLILAIPQGYVGNRDDPT